MEFENKVVIITGASSGIGAATAIELSKKGADLVIVGRNKTKINNVAAECAKHGKTPHIIIADLVKDDDVKEIVDETVAKYGKIDVLVNNAGYSISQPFVTENSVEVFDEILKLNLRSVVQLTHYAVPHLIKTKGNIVNVSSVASTIIWDNNFAYGTAKAGLDHFSRNIAKELAPNVRVNIVNPGAVRTDFLVNMGLSNIDTLYESLAKRTPMKRVAEPQEIADVIVFLASEKAKGVTGSAWISDNGTSLL